MFFSILKKNRIPFEKGEREEDNTFVFHQNKQVNFDVYFRASSTHCTGNESVFQGLGRFEN